MNIVYIHSHDTGRYIQPYGHAVPTPHLAQLAREGVLFRHAYAAAPTCSPSRAGLLTGMAPHSCGMIGLAGIGELRDPRQHLAHYLGAHGYVTVLSGQQHEVKSDSWGNVENVEQLGYRINLNRDNPACRKPLNHIEGNLEHFREMDLWSAALAANYIRDKSQSDSERPFFMSVGFFFPHRNYVQADPDIDPNYVMPPFPMYDSPENRMDWAMHLNAARIMDEGVGIVLQALRDSGLEKDTIVIYTTDHGIAFPRMKCNLHDTGIGVSLIVKAPGKASGIATDAMVSHLDVFPTICDLIGIEKPEWLQGYSMVPLLEGRTDRIREELFAEVTYHCAYEPMRAIRTERYKLIRYYEDYAHPVLPNIDDSPSKTFLLEHGYRQSERETEMLFDLFLDPVERENRADDPRYREIRDRLSARLQQWMEDTEDPLLRGKVPKPEGKLVRTVTSLSPQHGEQE